jgi:hypothetical protein
MIDRQEIEDALRARLVALGVPESMPGDAGAITPGEVAMQNFRTRIAALKRVESWVGKMDGADTFGPFRRYVFGRVKNAADAYRSDKAKYLKQFSDLFESIRPTLKPAIIAAPELGYTFGKDAGGSGINEIVHAILHTGNASNKRKLLLGRDWAWPTRARSPRRTLISHKAFGICSNQRNRWRRKRTAMCSANTSTRLRPSR